MYRSPRSSGGGSGLLMLLFLLWGAFYLTGCADVATSPAFDEFDDFDESPLPTVELEDLELTIDPDIVMSVIAEIEAELGPNPSAVTLNEIQDAVGLFQMAQVEYSNGNYQRVQELGEAARMALSRSLVRERGSVGIDDRIARTDDLRARLQAGDTQDFDRTDELSGRLSKLVDQANDARSIGNDVLAGARMVEAGQHTDRSRGRKHDRDRDRGHATDVSARLAVAMASNAVELASRLLDGRDVSERQLHLLEAAARLAAGAAEALEGGRFRAATMLGHKAVSTSLWAVVAPEVTEDEVRLIKDLAEEMLEASQAALAAAAILVVLLLPRPQQSVIPVPARTTTAILVEFRLEAPGAMSVALAGDFNDWETDMVLEDRDGDGVWTGRVPIEPGIHKYMFVIDGTEWVTDPDAERYSDDGFGNRNAVLAVTPIT